MSLVLPSNPDLHRIYIRAVVVHLIYSIPLKKNPNYRVATCRQLLVSTTISEKLVSGISNAPTTQLCLHYLWLNHDQRCINRKPETALFTLALYQQRTTGEQPTMPRPQYLCTNLDSRHPGLVSQPYSSGGAALAWAVLAATAMTQTCQQSLCQRYINHKYDNHVRNTFVCPVIRDFVSTVMRE